MKKKTTTETKVKLPVGRPKKKRPVGRPKKVNNIKKEPRDFSLDNAILKFDVQYLEQEVRGYRTIISYLERQLGLNQTQRDEE